ncbi:hypothetical protein pb186bvf_004057 [Paramecium bursaria]
MEQEQIQIDLENFMFFNEIIEKRQQLLIHQKINIKITIRLYNIFQLQYLSS